MLPLLYRLTKLHHILTCCRCISSCGRYNKLNVLAHPKTAFEIHMSRHIRTFCLCHYNFSWSRSMNYSFDLCQFKRTASFCSLFGLFFFFFVLLVYFFRCVRHNEGHVLKAGNLQNTFTSRRLCNFGNQIRGFYWILAEFNSEHIDALKYFIY